MGGIFNLSKKELTEHHKSLLNKGMKFAPDNKPDHFQMFIDANKFIRNINLKKYFMGVQKVNPTVEKKGGENINREELLDITSKFAHTVLKNKSEFIPKVCNNECIDTFKRIVTKELKSMKSPVGLDNLTNKEKEALKDLKLDKTIVIKPADKGGGVVILNLEDYDGEMSRLLSDKETYLRLSGDPTTRYKRELETILIQARDLGILNKQEFSFLNINYPWIPVIYYLPKIHKNSEHPPGRPIVSGINSLTSRVASYIHSFLQKYVTTMKSYLRDSQHLIEILRNYTVTEDLLLVSCDVISLYTCIPLTLGLEAIKCRLSRDLNMDREQKEFIANCVSFCLSHNYFWYSETFYNQQTGTAMGAKFAPNYANL